MNSLHKSIKVEKTCINNHAQLVCCPPGVGFAVRRLSHGWRAAPWKMQRRCPGPRQTPWLDFLRWWVGWFSRWWFQTFFIFTPNPGEDSHFDEHIFQMGWFNHQLVLVCFFGGEGLGRGWGSIKKNFKRWGTCFFRMRIFFGGGGGKGRGKVWKRNLLIERWHGHPCARIAQKDVNRQNWTTSWTFFHCNRCNRKKNHEKSPSRLGGLEDVLAMWKFPAPLGNDPVWKSCCSFWIWMVQLPTGHAFSRNIMSIRYWTRGFFCLSDSSSKETRKEGTNQKDIIKKNVKNAHENTWAVT